MKLSQALLLTALTLFRPITSQDSLPGTFMTCTKPGQFALTFDDGPSPYTPELLGILEQEHIKATFFLLGQYVSDPQFQPAMKQIHAAGHQIGVHTWDHPHMRNLTDAQIRDQITRTADAMKAVIPQVQPYYMRPPYGEVSLDTMNTLLSMGYIVVQWNIDSNDWRFNRTRSPGTRVLSEFVKQLATLPDTPSTPPTQSYISLQHDTEVFSVREVREVVRLVKAKGFTFVTIGDCLNNPKPWYRSDAPPPAPPAAAETKKEDGGVKGADTKRSASAQTATNWLLTTLGLVSAWAWA